MGVGLKERQAMQARARSVLDELVGTMFTWGAEDQHFKRTHLSQQWAGTYRKIRDALEPRLGADQVAEIFDPMQDAVRLAYGVLGTIAKDEVVKHKDLDMLSTILSSSPLRIRLSQATPHVSAASSLPYRRSDCSPVVLMAELLLEYMNLSALYGRVHWICQRKGCGTLMTGGRGGKKYCSPNCRKAAWAYQERKEYYDKKKVSSRTNAKRNKKATSKRTSHSIPKKKGAKSAKQSK